MNKLLAIFFTLLFGFSGGLIAAPIESAISLYDTSPNQQYAVLKSSDGAMRLVKRGERIEELNATVITVLVDKLRVSINQKGSKVKQEAWLTKASEASPSYISIIEDREPTNAASDIDRNNTSKIVPIAIQAH